MPRYFFDVIYGHASTCDDIGSDLPGLCAAKMEAGLLLVEMARDMLRRGCMHSVTTVVRDESGQQKMRVALSLGSEGISEPAGK